MLFQKEFHSIVAPFVWHWYAKEKQSHLRVTAFGCGKLKKKKIQYGNLSLAKHGLSSKKEKLSK